MDLSISQLSALTGRDRRTIAKNLKGVHYKPGERALCWIPTNAWGFCETIRNEWLAGVSCAIALRKE